VRRAHRADARRNVRRHRHRAALDPPAFALSTPDGRDGPPRRRAAARHERCGDRVRRRYTRQDDLGRPGAQG
jgi:hypothetical protein